MSLLKQRVPGVCVCVWRGEAEIQMHSWEIASEEGGSTKHRHKQTVNLGKAVEEKRDHEDNGQVFLFGRNAPTELCVGEPQLHFLIVHQTLEAQPHRCVEQTISFPVSMFLHAFLQNEGPHLENFYASFKIPISCCLEGAAFQPFQKKN